MRTTTSVNHAGTRERDRFELDIVCPNCGASGGARVFEGREFRVEAYPHGFSEKQRSIHRHETKVRCECDQEFYLI